MNFSKAALDALTALSSDNNVDLSQYFTPDNLNAEHMPTSPAFWQPGTAMTAIHSESPNKTALLLGIGSKRELRYALVLLKAESMFIEIDCSILDYIELDLINKQSYPSTGYRTNTIGQKLKQGRRVVPLDSNDLAKWLANINSTRAIEVFNSAKPVSQSFEA